MHKIALLGGTGFVGKHLIARLAQQKWQILALTRRREEHRELLVLPTLKMVSINPYDQAQLNAQLAGCDVVINLVGILNETGSNGEGFRKAHFELPQKIGAACQANNIKRLLHVSALHADAKQGKSHYLRTKGEAEDFLHAQSNLHVTSFRPSVIFGEDDNFFNQFALMLKVSPIVAVVPCPQTRFAPVWVNDVVSAMLQSIDDPKHFGQRYNLCGPSVYTHEALWKYTAKLLGMKRRFMLLSDKQSQMLAKVMESWVGQITSFILGLQGKPFSSDNYQSLQKDSICPENHFSAFGITPRSIETELPRYLASHTPRAAYTQFRHQARR